MKLCGFEIGLQKKFLLIAGTCVIESEQMTIDTAGKLKEITTTLGIPFIYKSSFDKANRSSSLSFRGLGMEKGLKILEKVKKQINIPVLTDVHAIHEIQDVSVVVDVLQIPALLCRQTDLIQACVESGKPVNIKKGQFLSPFEMRNVVDKARIAAKNAGVIQDNFMICERGTCFGYNNLVSDMRSLVIMREYNIPIIFDATHSVQLPGLNGANSGGQRHFVNALSRAAIAVGISGLFIETHPNPAKAMSDGSNSISLSTVKDLLNNLLVLDNIVKNTKCFQQDFDRSE